MMLHKIFDHKLFYLLFALVISVCLWVYVDISSDDVTVARFNNIPVTFEGEETLADRGLMIIHDVDGETVNLRLQGKRSDISKLDKDNISVTVRTSQITSAGEQQLEYTITYPRTVSENAISVEYRSVSSITCTVVAEATRQIPVVTDFTGSVAEGYWADTVTSAPETVSISGPQDLVEQVESAVVTIDNYDVDTTIAADYSFKLVDAEGNAVDTEDIVCDTDLISISMRVGMLAQIPLTVSVLEGGGAETADAQIEIEPRTITVAGDESLLDNVTSVDLGTIDLSQILTTTTITRDITLVDGLENISGTTSADITVTISGLDTRSFDTGNIILLNPPQGFVVDQVTESLNVVLRGKTALLNQVTADNITVQVDLSTVDVTTGSTGTISVPAVVTISGVDGVGAVGTYNVVVSIN